MSACNVPITTLGVFDSLFNCLNKLVEILFLLNDYS